MQDTGEVAELPAGRLSAELPPPWTPNGSLPAATAAPPSRIIAFETLAAHMAGERVPRVQLPPVALTVPGRPDRRADERSRRRVGGARGAMAPASAGARSARRGTPEGGTAPRRPSPLGASVLARKRVPSWCPAPCRNAGQPRSPPGAATVGNPHNH